MLATKQLMHLRCSCRLLLLLLLLQLGPGSPAEPDPHLRKLFAALDKDHDGQLIKSELRSYIKNTDSSYSSSTTLDQAVERAIGRLDSPDVGLGVSRTELEQHLHTLLQVRLVPEQRTAGNSTAAVQGMAWARLLLICCTQHHQLLPLSLMLLASACGVCTARCSSQLALLRSPGVMYAMQHSGIQWVAVAALWRLLSSFEPWHMYLTCCTL